MSVFQTKAWQQSWWEAWGQTPGFELLGESEKRANGSYIARYRYKGIPIRSLECIGSSHRRVSTPRTEYNTLIGNKSIGQGDQYDYICELLTSSRWTEAVFSDFRINTREFENLKAVALDQGWKWRILEENVAYTINTTGSFVDYLNSLGKNTRLRVYNRRKLLESLGKVVIKDVEPGNEDSFFEHLKRFYRHRWNSPCFGGSRGMKFQRDFLQRLPQEGGKHWLSELWLNNRLISVLYNVEFEGRVYNIQGGFDETIHKKLSPGMLHFGYVIQRCFQNAEVKTFDMLVGEGKSENYKARIATDTETLASVMIIRSWLLRILYRLKNT